jgi:A/G-specific adenine glycosylase
MSIHLRAGGMTSLLLTWYGKNARKLPWRDDPTPYNIWVMEIMGQQTRIAQLLPYYTRFMARFPDVFALATAEVDEVLKLWEGLGYYARAHHLHNAAKVVALEHGGRFPGTAAKWRELPGVGDYTAAAITGVALNLPEAAVDGNVLRVYARLMGDSENIRTGAVRARARAFILAHIPKKSRDIRDYTQAWMELGALLCVPKNPRCAECPLSGECNAYAQGTQHVLPFKSKPNKKRHLEITVLVVRDEHGGILLRKRTERLLRGLWTYVLLDGPLNEDDVRLYIHGLGFDVPSLQDLGKAGHIFTHLVWHMRGFLADVTGEGTPPDGYAFVAAKEIQHIALPAALAHFKWGS